MLNLIQHLPDGRFCTVEILKQVQDDYKTAS
jgi:hypothetical protein